MSHNLSRVPKQRRPWDAALPPSSGSRLAWSRAWCGLTQCPGYRHCVFYFCEARAFGPGFRRYPAVLSQGQCRGRPVLGCRACLQVRVLLEPRPWWLVLWLLRLGMGFGPGPAISRRGPKHASLGMWSSAVRGCGPLLPLVWWVVPQQFRGRALWVQFPTIPGLGLLLGVLGWSLANPNGGPCECCSPPFLAEACCCPWCGGPSSFLADGPAGAVPRLPWVGPLLALVGWAVSLTSHLANVDAGPCGCCSPPLLAQTCCWLWWFWWCLPNPGGWRLSVFLHGWSLLLASLGLVAPGQSWQKDVWAHFPAVRGWGLLLGFVGWLVPRLPWPRAL